MCHNIKGVILTRLDYNIIQIKNNVLWDWQYSTEY